jgi:hypothetical protein
MARMNLLLLAWRGAPHVRADLERIGSYAQEMNPDIRARVVSDFRADRWKLAPLWFEPTLVVAMRRRGSRKLLPGRLLTARALGKAGEYARLAAKGFPVPRWTTITRDTRLDPQDWGPYVVEKPDRGGLGAFVRIRKTGRVAYTDPASLEPGHYGRKGFIAQEFIYTGPWPGSYRVMTLLGHAIHSRYQVTEGRGRPLTSRWSFGQDGGRSIVSNTKSMKVELIDDAEIIQLCERAHREAFRDVPLLGFDLVRDADTGKLYFLECHSHGPNWDFSGPMGHGIQADNGLDFEAQFDGIRKAARVLADATDRLAARRLPFQQIPEEW